MTHFHLGEDFDYVMKAIVQHEKVIFCGGNNDSEFIFCLCHHLYKFLLHDNRTLR